MKFNKILLFTFLSFFILFSFNSCDKKITTNISTNENAGSVLAFEIGDLLAQTHYISGEATVWIFEYKNFPAVILDDIEKDGLKYILVLRNGLTGAKTKVSVKKGTILNVKKSLPLDMDYFGTYEAIMGARGHIPNDMKIVNISKTKLVVEVSEK